MRAYDIAVLPEGEVPESLRAGDEPLAAGWAEVSGPAIDPVTWPRSPADGQPMNHCFTLWLPQEYRRRDPSLCALSVFQWDDERCHYPNAVTAGTVPAAGRVPDREPGHRFWADLAAARAHPHSVIVYHPDTGTFYGFLWLNEQEYAGPRSQPPTPQPVSPEDVVSGSWRSHRFGRLWLIPRADPHAGFTPAESDDATLGQARQRASGDPRPWNKYEHFAYDHLGGMVMDPDGPGPEACSPWYLEIQNLGTFDFAADNFLRVDLDNPSLILGIPASPTPEIPRKRPFWKRR